MHLTNIPPDFAYMDNSTYLLEFLVNNIGAIFDFWSGRTCPPLGRTGNMTGEDLGGHQRKWGGLRRTANKTGEKTLIQPELNS